MVPCIFDQVEDEKAQIQKARDYIGSRPAVAHLVLGTQIPPINHPLIKRSGPGSPRRAPDVGDQTTASDPPSIY